MAGISERLVELLGAEAVLSGAAISDDYGHDEALGAEPHLPDVVVRPASAQDVAPVVRLAVELGVAVTVRGSGTGLSGGCIPRHGGILISFERMDAIIEIDTENHMAVVQPGVTLDQLDRATAAHGLIYPVFPGENSASLGGNVATNAGGMRAVKYGVTRDQVLGVEAVLGTGEIIRTGGKLVKSTSGYDLTQLIIGSEGTLAIVTEAILRLYPRLPHSATVLAPFRSIDEVAGAVPPIVGSGGGEGRGCPRHHRHGRATRLHPRLPRQGGRAGPGERLVHRRLRSRRRRQRAPLDLPGRRGNAVQGVA